MEFGVLDIDRRGIKNEWSLPIYLEQDEKKVPCMFCYDELLSMAYFCQRDKLLLCQKCNNSLASAHNKKSIEHEHFNVFLQMKKIKSED